MRNLSGGGLAVTRGCRGHPLAPRPGPPVPPAPFTPVAPGCCCVGSLDICLAFGTKFSLLGLLVVRTVQNSPCMQKKRQIEPFRASGESFVPHMRWEGVCWESFVPEVGRPWVLLLGFPAHGHWGGAFRTRRCAPRRWRWGFCTTRSPLTACRRRVAPSCSAIPPVEGPA